MGEIVIHGSKGSGKSGGGSATVYTPREAPNTLRTRTTARVIDVLCEGPIGGLVAGAQSVFFDDTPLQSPSGEYNFAGVAIYERTGEPDQEPILGFPQAENEVGVGVKVTAGSPVTRTVASGSSIPDAIRVTIRGNALFRQETNGDLNGTSVEFDIQLRVDGGAWQSTSSNRTWRTFTGTTSPSDATGLRFTIRHHTPRQDTSFTAQTRTVSWSWALDYRPAGGAWVRLRQVSGTQAQRAVQNVSMGGGSDRPVTYYFPEVTHTWTAEATGLPAGAYEYRIVGASVTAQALVLVPTVISDKTTSPWELSYRVDLPPGGSTYEIRVRRITPDAASAAVQDEIYWSSYTEIVDALLRYPDTALVGVAVNAEQFGNRIPRRSYEILGRVIQVPTNYYRDGPPITNLLLWSEHIDNAVWTKTGAAVSANVATDPNGLAYTADLLTEDSSTGAHQAAQVVAKDEEAGVYTASFHVRAAGRTKVRARVHGADAGDYAEALFDLAAGTANGTTAVGGFSAPAAKITRLGNGWYRCALTAMSDASDEIGLVVALADSTGATTYAGDGSSGVYLWGAQIIAADCEGIYYVSTDAHGSGPDGSRPRFYDGIWDGTFKNEVNDNPAWVLYDLISHPRFGLGHYIDTIFADKWALYEAARYNDGLVPDGQGGLEPRFTFNGIIETAEDAFKVLQAVASAMRASVYWGSNLVTITQDSPADPVKLVTGSNTQGGVINYESTGLNARRSVAMVTWNDPAHNYEASPITVEDHDLLAMYGWRQADVVAIGSTRRSQAIRHGLWLLDTDKHARRIATYRTGLDHLDVRPGDVIKVSDRTITAIRGGGRIAAATTTEVTLDAPVTLVGGQTYVLSVVLPDGSVEERETLPVLPGPNTTLTLATPLSAAPQAGAIWVLNQVEPQQFRVVNIREVEPLVYEVLAAQHDPTKYARIEAGLVAEAPNYSALPTGPIAPPSHLHVAEYLYRPAASVLSAATLSFQPSPDPRVVYHEIEVKAPGQAQFQLAGTVEGSRFDLMNTTSGVYEFRVRALTGLGQSSDYVSISAYLQATLIPPADVATLRVAIVDGAAHLSWPPVTSLNLDHYEIRFTPLTTGTTWGSSLTLVEYVSRDATGITVPAMIGTYMIKGVSTGDVYSVNAASVVSNVAGLVGMNAIESLEDGPTWAGTHDGTVLADGRLTLASSSVMADWDTLADVPSLSYGTGGVVPSATYVFSQIIDLGEVYTARVWADVRAAGTNLLNVMSTWATLAEVENLAGDDADAWDLVLEIRTTLDDPEGDSPEWTGWAPLVIGDYTARAVQARLHLTSSNPAVTALVEQATLYVDMPDRVARGDDVPIPAETTVITFTPAFRAPPAIGVSMQDAQAGDYFEIGSKTASGFEITCRDSDGNPVARTIDWIAVGYGHVGGVN